MQCSVWWPVSRSSKCARCLAVRFNFVSVVYPLDMRTRSDCFDSKLFRGDACSVDLISLKKHSLTSWQRHDWPHPRLVSSRQQACFLLGWSPVRVVQGLPEACSPQGQILCVEAPRTPLQRQPQACFLREQTVFWAILKCKQRLQGQLMIQPSRLRELASPCWRLRLVCPSLKRFRQ